MIDIIKVYLEDLKRKKIKKSMIFFHDEVS